MPPRRRLLTTLLLAALAGVVASAQNRRGGGRGEPPPDTPWNANESFGPIVYLEGGVAVNEDTVRNARETASHSTGTPEWGNRKGFEKDVFTFARLVFKTSPNYGDIYNYRGRLGWWVDYPDADLNFSYRLQQMTSIPTDPDGRVVRLGDPDLTDFPVIFTTHVENMRLSEREVEKLRAYLLNGGALFIADFWGTRSWDHFEGQMKRVLPGRGWTELQSDHPIFHCVFDLKGTIEDWQVPTMQFWNRGHDPRDPSTPPLQKRDRGPGSEHMHVRAWLDEKGRISIIAIHNSDIPDGWEREGEFSDYFHKFSEKIAYPMGVNIFFYLMTH
ncbi:MAG: hypothetical protein RLZZ15_4130 [Verrucomicrobiota bacterium]|jgi:hypothetical protein